ncbi:MAG: hypothetical protein C4575_09785 [Desulforudis sp.]|nr:MAG: hypothetical protein C4575_09785 [Desulforudis sp.]
MPDKPALFQERPALPANMQAPIGKAAPVPSGHPTPIRLTAVRTKPAIHATWKAVPTSRRSTASCFGAVQTLAIVQKRARMPKHQAIVGSEIAKPLKTNRINQFFLSLFGKRWIFGRF